MIDVTRRAPDVVRYFFRAGASGIPARLPESISAEMRQADAVNPVRVALRPRGFREREVVFSFPSRLESTHHVGRA